MPGAKTPIIDFDKPLKGFIKNKDYSKLLPDKKKIDKTLNMFRNMIMDKQMSMAYNKRQTIKPYEDSSKSIEPDFSPKVIRTTNMLSHEDEGRGTTKSIRRFNADSRKFTLILNQVLNEDDTEKLKNDVRSKLQHLQSPAEVKFYMKHAKRSQLHKFKEGEIDFETFRSQVFVNSNPAYVILGTILYCHSSNIPIDKVKEVTSDMKLKQK